MGATASAVVTEEEKKRKENGAKDKWVNKQTTGVADTKIKESMAAFLDEALEKKKVTIDNIIESNSTVATSIQNLITDKYYAETKPVVDYIIIQLADKAKKDWLDRFDRFNLIKSHDDKPETVKNKLTSAMLDVESIIKRFTIERSTDLNNYLAKTINLEAQIPKALSILGNKNLDEVKDEVKDIVKAAEENFKKDAMDWDSTMKKLKKEEEEAAEKLRLEAEKLRLEAEKLRLEAEAAAAAEAEADEENKRVAAEAARREAVEAEAEAAAVAMVAVTAVATAAAEKAAAEKAAAEKAAAEKAAAEAQRKTQTELQFTKKMRSIEDMRRQSYNAIENKLQEVNATRSKTITRKIRNINPFDTVNKIKKVLKKLEATNSKLIELVNSDKFIINNLNLNDEYKDKIEEWRINIAEAFRLITSKDKSFDYTSIINKNDKWSFIDTPITSIINEGIRDAKAEVEADAAKAVEAAEAARAEKERARAEKERAEAAARAEKERAEAVARAAARAEKERAEEAATRIQALRRGNLDRQRVEAYKKNKLAEHPITKAIKIATTMIDKINNEPLRPFSNLGRYLDLKYTDKYTDPEYFKQKAEFELYKDNIENNYAQSAIRTLDSIESNNPREKKVVANIKAMVEAIRDNTIKAIKIFVVTEDPNIQKQELNRNTGILEKAVKEANAKIDSTQQGLEILESDPYYNDWTTRASEWNEQTNMYEIMYNKVNKKFLERKVPGDPVAATRLGKLRLSPSTRVLPNPATLPAPIRRGGVKTRKKRRRRRKRRKIFTKNNKNKK